MERKQVVGHRRGDLVSFEGTNHREITVAKRIPAEPGLSLQGDAGYELF